MCHSSQAVSATMIAMMIVIAETFVVSAARKPATSETTNQCCSLSDVSPPESPGTVT